MKNENGENFNGSRRKSVQFGLASDSNSIRVRFDWRNGGI